ncbi:hypothetical protein AB1Y20_012893 [Prymnesium parvum]|uniref:Uncharacterized protein n=1 Tax=Prymnesium parvum TaxID=97485 RepID=A0AB34IJ55_PRYPA
MDSSLSPYVGVHSATNTLQSSIACSMVRAQSSPAINAVSPTNTEIPAARKAAASLSTAPSPPLARAPASGTRYEITTSAIL